MSRLMTLVIGVLVLMVVGRSTTAGDDGRTKSHHWPTSQIEAIRAAEGHPSGEMGFPQQGRLLVEDGYISGYSGFWKSSLWEIYHITPESMATNAERGSRFHEDKRIPIEFRPTLKMYRGARTSDGEGLDRGHLKSSHVSTSSDSVNDASFSLVNMSPQRASFNRGGTWRKAEDAIKEIFLSHPEISSGWVAVGPALIPTVDVNSMPNNKVATVEFVNGLPVPTHYWMSVLVQLGGDYVISSCLIPHVGGLKDEPKKYSVTVDEIERVTGLDLWSGLPDDVEDARESVVRGFE